MRTFLLSLITLTMVPTAFADIAKAAVSPPSLSTSLFNVFMALTLIVGLILACAWLAKKFKLTGSMHVQGIRALSSLTLGRKEKVVLISVGGKRLLLGVAAGSVNVLHTFDSSDDTDSYHPSQASSTQDEPSQPTSFVEKAQANFPEFLNTLMANGRSNER